MHCHTTQHPPPSSTETRPRHPFLKTPKNIPKINRILFRTTLSFLPEDHSNTITNRVERICSTYPPTQAPRPSPPKPCPPFRSKLFPKFKTIPPRKPNHEQRRRYQYLIQPIKPVRASMTNKLHNSTAQET